MSKDLNRVQLIGHLGGDPEVRTLDTGTGVTTFSVATKRTWKDAQGQPQSETEWSRVVAWGRLAEIAGDYLRKGRHVYIEGRLRTRQWQDQDGRTRSTSEVVAEDLILLDSRPLEGTPAATPEAVPHAQTHQRPPPARPAATTQRQAEPHRAPRGNQAQPQREQAPPVEQADEEDLPF